MIFWTYFIPILSETQRVLKEKQLIIDTVSNTKFLIIFGKTT